MSNRGFLALLAAIGFIGLLAFGLLAKNKGRPDLGDPVPDATAQVLGGTKQVTLADYRGQWVLVNLWASWCKPCEDEAPAIESYTIEHAKDLKVVGIATDDATDDALRFARRYHLTYDLLHDGPGAFKQAWGATGLPETMLIDPDGNVALSRIGVLDKSYLDASVTPLVTAKEPS